MCDRILFAVWYVSLMIGPLIMISDRLRSTGLAVLTGVATFWGALALCAAKEADEAVPVMTYALFGGAIISLIMLAVREWRSTRKVSAPPQEEEKEEETPEAVTDSR